MLGEFCSCWVHMLIRSSWVIVFNIYVGFFFSPTTGGSTFYHHEMTFLIFRNAHYLKRLLWILGQDDRVEGLELTYSHENTEITTIC